MENAQETEVTHEIREREISVPVGLSEKFQSFKMKQGMNSEDEFMYYIYKFENPSSKQRSLLDKTVVEPDEHEIGCTFGSGKYEVFMVLKGTEKARSYTIHLHKRYDDLMEQKKKEATQLPVPAGAAPYGGMMEQLAMVRTLIEAIKPLTNPGDPSTMAAAMGEMMKGMFTMQQQVMQQSMEGMLSMQARLAERMIDVDDDDVDEEEPVEERDNVLELIQQYLPLIEQYLPKILQGGTQSKVIASTVRSLPIFKNLMKDRESLLTLVEYLKQQYGPDKTESLLVNLGLKKERSKKPEARRRSPKARKREVTETGATE